MPLVRCMSALLLLHASASVSIRPHTSAYALSPLHVGTPPAASVSTRQHTHLPEADGLSKEDMPLVSIRQHTSAYVSIRQHTHLPEADGLKEDMPLVSIRQHPSAYVSIHHAVSPLHVCAPPAVNVSSKVSNKVSSKAVSALHVCTPPAV